MPILHILRHAKSSWDNTDLSDHERPLAPRGKRAMKAMSAYVIDNDVCPEVVVCSSAKRTQQTLARLRDALPDDVEVHVDERLYLASTGEMLELARIYGEGAQEVMLIGHNPGSHYLAVHMSGTGDPSDLASLRTKFPTAALASIRFERPLADVDAGDGELLAFVTPKSLG